MILSRNPFRLRQRQYSPYYTVAPQPDKTPPSRFGDDGYANELLRVYIVTDRLMIERTGSEALAVRVAMDVYRFTKRIFKRELCLRVQLAGVTYLRDEPFALDEADPVEFLDSFCRWASVAHEPESTNLVSIDVHGFVAIHWGDL